MRLIGNALNNDFFRNLLVEADHENLASIRLAVAYVRQMDELFDLAKRREVPLELYCLFDGNFPSKPIIDRFVDRHSPLGWRLFLTANFYHPKIYWFEGIGVYIGSANLTNQGWNNNLECGVWFDQEDVDREGLAEQLSAMFTVVRGRCTAATETHAQLLDAVKQERRDLRGAQTSFAKLMAAKLANIRGHLAPISVTKETTKGGAARVSFCAEWNETLGILHKLTELARSKPRPSWIGEHVHPAMIQDQATEWWYHEHIRSTRASRSEIERLHRQNRRDIEGAVAALFAGWQRFVPTDPFWLDWINSVPHRLEALLSRESLQTWDDEKMRELVWGSHASRDHARQMRKTTLGVPPGSTDFETCSRQFAAYLMRQRTEADRTVAEVLEYVIWGDAETPECAERLWRAVHDPDWKISHLGINILGEWTGYARPNDFPPRNGRVSKSLYALGHAGVAY